MNFTSAVDPDGGVLNSILSLHPAESLYTYIYIYLIIVTHFIVYIMYELKAGADSKIYLKEHKFILINIFFLN